MKKIDIVVAAYGGLEGIRECVDTWFPLPDDYNLYVYNSVVGDIDGTTDYFINKQKEYNFTLINEGKAIGHQTAIKKLMGMSSAPWVLNLDTDVKINNKIFYEETRKLTEHPTYKVWGKIDKTSFVPKFKAIKGKYRLLLPRLESWFVLSEKKFMLDKNISFTDSAFELKNRITNPLIIHGGKIQNHIDEDDIVCGDVSWQLYWSSMAAEVYGKLPAEILSNSEHRDDTSVRFKTKYRAEIDDLLKKIEEKTYTPKGLDEKIISNL